MKINTFLQHALFIILLSSNLATQAQRIINFSYDAAGNRTIREEAVPIMLLMDNADISTKIDIDSGNKISIAADKNKNIEIKFENKNKEELTGNYILYDISGRIVKKSLYGENCFNIELETLPRDIYVLRIQCNNKVVTRKIRNCLNLCP